MKARLPNIVWGKPASDRMAAPFVAQYNNWAKKTKEPYPNPEVEIINGARIFPGTITRRESKIHFGGQFVLNNDFCEVRASPGLLDGSYSLPGDVDLNAVPTELLGNHFFLGSAHRHFGHFVLEGLSRVWAWHQFAATFPNGRCIIYESKAPAFIGEMLERVGISRDRMLFMQEPLLVERLHAPDPAMRTHHWIDPKMTLGWQRIAQTTNPLRSDRKIYLSRNDVKNRVLRNEIQVEEIFRAGGFEIIRPETLPIEKQIEMVRGASSLAGCVGSQMYLAAFMFPGSEIGVIAPSNFYLQDDRLIADAMGHHLNVAFGESADFATKERSWTVDTAGAEALLEAMI